MKRRRINLIKTKKKERTIKMKMIEEDGRVILKGRLPKGVIPATVLSQRSQKKEGKEGEEEIIIIFETSAV